MDVINRYVTMKNFAEGMPAESDFEIRNASISLKLEANSNDVLVKNLYLSIDPYQLNRMKQSSSSHKAINFSTSLIPGQAIDAYGAGRVVVSDNLEFYEGDLVVGLLGWEDYTLVRGAKMLRKIDSTEFPLSYHVGILGLSGLTAYAGLYNVCKPKKGDTVFVSAASGSVGNLVGQYAKLFGCYTVGCASSHKKVDLLKETLGFDHAFNYKDEPDLDAALKRYFPEGIDVYFDNVGGKMLEAAVANMNPFGRVAVCGVISEYTDLEKLSTPDMLHVVYKRITIQGFLAADYMSSFADFIADTCDYLRKGKMHALQDISVGLESVPSAFVGLFKGCNVGKMMVQVESE